MLSKEQFNWVYDGGKIIYSTKHLQNTEKRTWTVKVKETMEADDDDQDDPDDNDHDDDDDHDHDDNVTESEGDDGGG